MADHHAQTAPPSREETTALRSIYFCTSVGLACNLVLAGLKFTAGVMGGSRAVAADAVHSLSDMITDMAILIGAKFWSAPADHQHPYGHSRIETVVTLFIGAMLAWVAVELALGALQSLTGETRPPTGWIACAAALVSIVSKEILYRWTIVVGKRTGSQALVANAHHHRSDALSSIPAALAAGVAALAPAWSLVDPVGAVVVCAFLLKTAWDISLPALDQLVDRGASEDRIRAISHLAHGVEHVRDVHAVRSRFVGRGMYVDMHVEVDPLMTVRESHWIAETVRAILLREPDIVDVVVHIEPHGDDDPVVEISK